MNELPKRKPNRLKNFDYSSNGAYFITICTQNRVCILSKIILDNTKNVGDGTLDVPSVKNTALSILTEYGEIVNKNIISGNKIPNITVDNYVIMPNHIHLILSIKNENIGTSKSPSPANMAIPHFVSTFKRFCHMQIGEKIFQRSYHDRIIRNEKEYLKIWEYIDNNPIRWANDCFYNEKKEG